MNKFLPLTGGHSLKLDEFMLMQNSYFDGFKALVTKLAPTGHMIVDGFNVDQSGVNVVYTSGYVTLNGEIFKIEAGFFAKSVNPADVLYLKPTQTVIAPSPVTYEDLTPKNVHFERKAILKYKELSDSDGVEYLELSYPGSIIEGGILPWYPPVGKTVSDFFDNTGLGIGKAKGYAICNGLNNTLDLRGVILPMATSVPFTGGVAPLRANLSGQTAAAGDEGGSGKVTILQTNIPNYSLPVTDPGHQHNLPHVFNESGTGNLASGGNTDEGAITDKTVSATTGITVSSGGSGTPIENRQASVYVYYIMRVR